MIVEFLGRKVEDYTVVEHPEGVDGIFVGME